MKGVSVYGAAGAAPLAGIRVRCVSVGGAAGAAPSVEFFWPLLLRLLFSTIGGSSADGLAGRDGSVVSAGGFSGCGIGGVSVGGDSGERRWAKELSDGHEQETRRVNIWHCRLVTMS